MRPPLPHELKHLHRTSSAERKRMARIQHQRFCFQVETFVEIVFAIKSQLDPVRLARYARAADPYAP